MTAARAALAAGDAAAAFAATGEPLAIAERGLLPGLEAGWIDVRRAELGDLRLEALEVRAAAGAAMGGPEQNEAERAARAAVEAAPFRESSRAALMEVLHARGNVAEALRVFEDVRVLLREELGTAPGPALVALHERLLREEPAPAPAAAAPAPAVSGLVERERELAALGALLGDALAGEGRTALIEGPAGVGKTRLLAEVRRRAESAGARVLSARGSDLERDFPFGVVRQLLEGLLADPAVAERAFAGAGAPARAVFERLDALGEGGSDFAALHGLYWVVLNLAAERPLVLSVDDLHWADRPSLRYLAYLARRLEGQPVLLAATLRTGEPDTDLALVGEIAGDAATGSVRPAPLSEAAAAEVVRGRLGADADDAFCAACHVTTGGNPLLLRQLRRQAAADAEGARRLEGRGDLRDGRRQARHVPQGRAGSHSHGQAAGQAPLRLRGPVGERGGRAEGAGPRALSPRPGGRQTRGSACTADSSGSTTSPDANSARCRTEAIAAPASGARMNSHSCSIAQPPTNSAGPMLRAGLTDVLVIGMPTRWISTSTSPIGIPANATLAIRSVADSTVKTRKKVSTISAISAPSRS